MYKAVKCAYKEYQEYGGPKSTTWASNKKKNGTFVVFFLLFASFSSILKKNNNIKYKEFCHIILNSDFKLETFCS